MTKFVRLAEGSAGFCEKVNDNGKRLGYYYVFKWAGQKVNFRLCNGNTTKKQAKSLYDKARALHKADIDPRQPVVADRAITKASKSPLIKDVLTEFDKRHLISKCKPNTRKDYLRHLNNHFDKSKTLQSYTRKFFQETFDKLTDKGQPTGVNRFLAYSKKFFNFAIQRDWYIGNNPVCGITKNRERPKKRVLNEHELKVLWTHLTQAEKASSQRNLFVLMILTGQRHGELKCLTRADLFADSFELSADITKNKREHLLPLPGFANKFVQSCVDPLSRQDSLIFPNKTNSRYETTSLCRWFRELIAKCGLPNDITAHDLRRTMATSMRRQGFDKSWVKAVLNHVENDVLTQHYDMYDMRKEKLECLTWWQNKLIEFA